jgi:putative DNA primase/helicase
VNSGRDDKLVSVACTMGRMIAVGWIGEATVAGRLFDACTANGLAKEKGHADIHDKIKRAIEKGMQNPHEPLPDRPPKPGVGTPDDVEIERLARLSLIQYDREREAIAEKLGIRVTAIDSAVKAERGKQSDDQLKFLPHWNVEPWPEPVDGDALLQALQAHFKRYIALPPHADVALALWTLHTWVFGCFDITPYLCISSPTRRCGKTLLMTMLLWLCCRGKKNDSMSKASIYRSVERDKPTLCLDEVGWVVDQRDERQNILCGGFERNGCAEVCEGEGANITTKMYSTFCPKAFGLIGKLTATLMDRSIEISMQRKTTEKVERLRRKDNEEHARFRRQCLRWAQDNAEVLAKATPELPAALHDRAVDYWEPLFAIAAHVGGDWPKLATEAALAWEGRAPPARKRRSSCFPI